MHHLQDFDWHNVRMLPHPCDAVGLFKDVGIFHNNNTNVIRNDLVLLLSEYSRNKVRERMQSNGKCIGIIQVSARIIRATTPLPEVRCLDHADGVVLPGLHHTPDLCPGVILRDVFQDPATSSVSVAA